MKKLLLCILTVFALAMGIFSLSACNQNSSGKFMICAFDEYGPLSEITYAYSFGKVDILEECEWKTQGKACIKASIDGSRNTAGRKPTMVIYTSSQYVKKADFSDIETFELDVYNDNEEFKYIYFQLKISQLDSNGNVSYLTSSQYSYKLPSKELTHVKWDFDRAFLMQLMDINAVTQVLLSFDNPTDGDFDVYYLDNFYATTTTKQAETIQARKEGEIESGDRPEYLAAWTATMPLHAPVELGYNSDPNYVKFGSGSIKVTAPDISKANNTPTISYNAKQPIDLTNYETIVMHVFNANEKDYNAYIRLSAVPYRLDFSLKAGEWTRVEIPLSTLKAYANLEEYTDAVYKKFSSFVMTFYFQESHTPLTFYIDEVYAVTGDTRPPEIEEVEYDHFEKDDTVTILKPDVVRGELSSWEVLAPNGDKVSENEETFVATETGVYTIVYKAWNRYDYQTYKASVKVGYPKINQTVYSVYYTEPTEFTVPVFASNAPLTWKLYNNSSGTEIAGTENKDSFQISYGEFYLEYTATNEFATETARVYIYCVSNFIRFEQQFSNFYSESYFKGVLGGDPVYVDSEKLVAYDQKAVKLLDSTVRLINLPLYGELSDNRVLNLFVYNPANTSVKLKVSGNSAYGEFTINANSRKLINIPFSWLKTWGAIEDRADGTYIDCKFGTGASPLYLYAFGFNNKAASSELELSEYSAEPETDGSTEYTVPTDINGAWTVRVYEKQSNEEMILTNGKFYPVPNTEYRFVYTLVNAYGEFTKEITLKFNDLRRATFLKVPENVLIVPDGQTKIGDYLEANKPTTSSKNDLISYTVRRYNPANPIGVTSYAGEDFDYTSYVKNTVFKTNEKWIYRVRWTVANQYGSSSYEQYIYAYPNAQALSFNPNSVSIEGNGAEFVNVGNAYRLKVTTTGTASVKITITGDYSAYTDKSLILFACNQSENKAQMQIMNSKGDFIAGYQGSYTMLNNGAALIQTNSALTKKLADYLDNDGNIVIKINIKCPEGTPEMYLDFIALV